MWLLCVDGQKADLFTLSAFTVNHPSCARPQWIRPPYYWQTFAVFPIFAFYQQYCCKYSSVCFQVHISARGLWTQASLGTVWYMVGKYRHWGKSLRSCNSNWTWLHCPSSQSVNSSHSTGLHQFQGVKFRWWVIKPHRSTCAIGPCDSLKMRLVTVIPKWIHKYQIKWVHTYLINIHT